MNISHWNTFSLSQILSSKTSFSFLLLFLFFFFSLSLHLFFFFFLSKVYLLFAYLTFWNGSWKVGFAPPETCNFCLLGGLTLVQLSFSPLLTYMVKIILKGFLFCRSWLSNTSEKSPYQKHKITSLWAESPLHTMPNLGGIVSFANHDMYFTQRIPDGCEGNGWLINVLIVLPLYRA